MIIDELTNRVIQDPDLSAGELSNPVLWAPPESYATIDMVNKFALDDSDYVEVQMYHRYTEDQLEAMAAGEARQALDARIDAMPDQVDAYTDETDAALFDLVDYVASLEARIAALEA